MKGNFFIICVFLLIFAGFAFSEEYCEMGSIVKYWDYDGTYITIGYPHIDGVIKIEIEFEEKINNASVVFSNSNIIEEKWEDNEMIIRLEGNPKLMGETKINSHLEPVSLRMEEDTLQNIKEALSPSDAGNLVTYILIAALSTVIIVMVIFGNSAKRGDIHRIKRYIIHARNKGHHDTHIKSDLLWAGWKSDPIDRAFKDLKK